jgi:hypothetical protein
MENINVKIPKGTVVKIEGFPFQLTSSLDLKVSDKVLKLEGHTLLSDEYLKNMVQANGKVSRG